MWSEDLGQPPARTSEDEKTEKRRPAERVSEGALRWLFVFDGWRLEPNEDEFVLA